MKRISKRKKKQYIAYIVAGIVAILTALGQSGTLSSILQGEEDLSQATGNIGKVTASERSDDTSDTEQSTESSSVASSPGSLNEATVVRVVDGDTLVVNYQGTDEKVRLIGVDTPESVASDSSRNTEEGKEASNYTKSVFSQGDSVWLEFDASERDKYGRILAYVWLDSDGKTMYNLELVQKGYARVMTIQPNDKYVDLFTEAQTKARNAKKGFWDDGGECWDY